MARARCAECGSLLSASQCEFPPAEPGCTCNGCLAPVCEPCLIGVDSEDDYYAADPYLED